MNNNVHFCRPIYSFINVLQDKIISPSHDSDAVDDIQSSEPSPDCRLLMDKTASYMTRNGRHLEAAVQSKGGLILKIKCSFQN